MRLPIALIVCSLAFSSLAHAQTASSSSSERGYIEGFAQAAFGNVTSQSYGGEIGYELWPDIELFVEGGVVRNVATSDIGAAAQQIASYLAGPAGQPNVAYSVKQPVGFGDAGVRYLFSTGSNFKPYVLGGIGFANVKNDVHFLVNGNDVTTSMQQFGVTLGSDLAGSETKALLTLGGGVAWPVRQPIVIDFQVRYGRIFTSPGINVGRAGVGVGIRF